MKLLISLSLLFFGTITFANTKLEMTCLTEYPSTTFIISEDNDVVVLEIFNHNGIKYAPIYDGLPTPNDIPLLQDAASAISSLHSNMRFEWPRSKCEKKGQMLMKCFGETDEKTLNNTTYSAWSFVTSTLVEENIDGVYKSWKVRLNLTVDGKSYSIPMRYEENECHPASLYGKDKALKGKK